MRLAPGRKIGRAVGHRGAIGIGTNELQRYGRVLRLGLVRGLRERRSTLVTVQVKFSVSVSEPSETVAVMTYEAPKLE